MVFQTVLLILIVITFGVMALDPRSHEVDQYDSAWQKKNLSAQQDYSKLPQKTQQDLKQTQNQEDID